jgi:hypothetical protein
MLSPETMEPTTEETDLLSRSSKKVKVGDNNNHADGDTRQGLSREGKGGISYRDSLMGSPYLCHNTSDESLLVDCISEDEDDDCDEEDCPVIRLSVEENVKLSLTRIRKRSREKNRGMRSSVINFCVLFTSAPLAIYTILLILNTFISWLTDS